MLASKKEKCVGDMHLFDIEKKKLDIRCRCGANKSHFTYIMGQDLTMRVRIHKKRMTSFKGTD